MRSERCARRDTLWGVGVVGALLALRPYGGGGSRASRTPPRLSPRGTPPAQPLRPRSARFSAQLDSVPVSPSPALPPQPLLVEPQIEISRTDVGTHGHPLAQAVRGLCFICCGWQPKAELFKISSLFKGIINTYPQALIMPGAVSNAQADIMRAHHIHPARAPQRAARPPPSRPSHPQNAAKVARRWLHLILICNTIPRIRSRVCLHDAPVTGGQVAFLKA